MIFYVKKLNNGQSEIWLSDEPSDQRHTQYFSRGRRYGRGPHFRARLLKIGEETSYEGPSVAEIATKLGLIVVGS